MTSTILTNFLKLGGDVDDLGPNKEVLLDFWVFVESLNDEQLKSIFRNIQLYFPTDLTANDSLVYFDYYRNPGMGNALWNACFESMDSFQQIDYYCIIVASREIIAMHRYFEAGKPLQFLPFFNV